MAGLLSCEEINPEQLVSAVLAAVEEARGVLRFGECLGGLGRLFGLFSRRMRWPVVGLAVVRRTNRISTIAKAGLVRCFALVSQCVSFDSLFYDLRQELLQHLEFNANLLTDQLKRKSSPFHFEDGAQCLRGEDCSLPKSLLDLVDG
jgi:hypothetical protein